MQQIQSIHISVTNLRPQHQFRISYRIILREKELHLNIGVYNPSKETPFDFNVLLHSYFKCPDVRRCQVRWRWRWR